MLTILPGAAAHNPDTPNGGHCILPQESKIRRNQGGGDEGAELEGNRLHFLARSCAPGAPSGGPKTM